MGDTLKVLRRMVKWCPWCNGNHENITEIIHAPPDTLDVIYESVPDCPKCREARACIKELEACGDRIVARLRLEESGWVEVESEKHSCDGCGETFDKPGPCEDCTE